MLKHILTHSIIHAYNKYMYTYSYTLYVQNVYTGMVGAKAPSIL